MATHLSLPRQVFDGFFFILVTFDVGAGEVEWEEMAQDVDNFAFQLALGGQAVVGTVPRSARGRSVELGRARRDDCQHGGASIIEKKSVGGRAAGGRLWSGVFIGNWTGQTIAVEGESFTETGTV